MPSGSEETTTPGYDQAAVNAWISENVEGLTPPFRWEQLEGGHSNLTYAITDTEGREAVIRRPPMGELLPKAHDMGREFKIISGLGDTNVPVAKAYGYCEDPNVTGAHFYVMSKVPGRAMYSPEDVEDWLSHEARARMADSFMETLASLHSIEPASVGLDDLGRPDGYVARQLRTWYGSWTASVPGANYDDDRIHALHEMFQNTLPEQGPARVVHGDYGPHNCMVAADGNLTAILDWEISTLGDPMADFAYAINGWGDPDIEGDDGVSGSATTAPGFPKREVLIAKYAELTGADLSMLPYYRAFNFFKTACILHGVYSRYMEGKKSTEGVDIPDLFQRMKNSIQFAESSAAEL
ncbi:MAG: aminoglycoside phosphotransferase (APT) family kinase protein [Acidimicrobiales bacterium]